MGSTLYSFGIDMAAGHEWTRDTMFKAYVLKSRTGKQKRNFGFFPLQSSASEVRGYRRDSGIIDDGNFRLVAAHGGRMSSEPNFMSQLTSQGETTCVLCEKIWGTCSHSGGVDVDAETMQLICEKAGETASMADPHLRLKFDGPPDRRRAYG